MESVILEYHKGEGGSGSVGYWTGKILGRDMKLVRVVAGLAFPDDRQASALVILGELFRSFAAPAFTGIAASVGTWPEVKNALLQFCRDLKPDRIIVQDEPSRKLVFPITDSLIGAPVVPSTYAAPAHALTELGRQNVEALINEGRLHLEHLLDVMDQEKEPADKALRCAVNFALEFTAFYPGKKRPQPKYGRQLGEF
jgi:hypothetical protein